MKEILLSIEIFQYSLIDSPGGFLLIVLRIKRFLFGGIAEKSTFDYYGRHFAAFKQIVAVIGLWLTLI